MSLLLRLFVVCVLPLEILLDTPPETSSEDIIKIVTTSGYPIETHHVTTEDGYILGIFRIPHGKNSTKINDRPILVSHGMFGSAENFIMLGPKKSLAYILADTGYDVWLINCRGTGHSKKHVTLKSEQKEFWDFSWHEMGIYDLPAVIDYILDVTNKENIFYVGHSQGGTIALVMASEKPDYNKKIKLMIGLGAGAFYRSLTHSFAKGFAINYKLLKNLLESLHLYELPPPFFSDEDVRTIIKALCVDSTALKNTCKTLFLIVTDETFDWKSFSTLPVPASVSTKQAYHYAQLINSGNFQHYDYGPEQNKIKYGTPDPPLYNLKNVNFPVVLFSGKGDILVSQNEQKIAYDGYPLETYETTTEDNYILAIYRIPFGRRSKNKKKRSPVLLVHGLGSSADMFILLGRYRSVAYNLADSGFDVWFLSARGTRKSQKHVYYDINKDRNYWNFTYHEIAVYDLAATMDFIVEKTNEKMFLIGHSQGNTCYFVLFAEKPEYNEKVKVAVAYAPSVKIYLDIPIAALVIYILDIVKALYDLIDLRELFPYIPNSVNLLKNLCKEQTYFLELCVHGTSIIGSHRSHVMDRDLLPVIISGIHGRASIMQIFQYMQNIRSGRFSRYDYGPKLNKQIYNAITPPLYDLKKVTAPVALFHAPNDDIVTKQGSDELAKELPNVYFYEDVDFKYFNHIDFLFGKNASELVYQKTIKLFKDFDKKSVQ